MPAQQSEPNLFESRQKSASGKAGSQSPKGNGSNFSLTSAEGELLRPDDDLVTPSRLRECTRRTGESGLAPVEQGAESGATASSPAEDRQTASASEGNAGEEQSPARTASLEACLRAAREAKGLSIDQVSDDLKLRSDIVVCLEHGNFDFAHRVYVNGFLRAYAEYLGKETLGMSPDEAAEALKTEHPEVFEPEPEAIELQPLQPKGVPKLAVALVLFLLIGAIGVAVWFWQENSPQTRIEAAPAVPEKLSLYLPADD